MRYEHHVFVCTNQKPEGKACCGEARGTEILNHLKNLMADHPELKGKVRIQKSGCLDACKMGPAMVVYPEGTYYTALDEDKLNTIFEQHILGGKVVESLEQTAF